MFKAGDLVRVKDDLIIEKEYNGCKFTKGMQGLKGNIYRIMEKKQFEHYGDARYVIKESLFLLSDDMIELITNNDREKLFKSITDDLLEIYKAKNSDYGNSVGDTYEKLGDVSFLTRILDKVNRATTLVTKNEQKVNDEKLEDTIQDMINYGILWLIEKNITQHTEE